MRGSFEEGYPNENSTTLLAGIFNHKDGELVPELVSMPNGLALTITINGETFRLDEGKILGYERVLDLKTATLSRGVLWMSPKQDVIRLAFERFASLDNPYVMALNVLIQVLSEGTHEVSVTSSLDATVLNPGGIDHWGNWTVGVNGDITCFEGTAEQSGYHVAMQSQVTIDGVDANWLDVSETRKPSAQATFTLKQNQKITVTKYIAVQTSRTSNDPVKHCGETLRQAYQAGYESLKQAHDSAWADYWDKLDIIIEGDEVAQLAVRFCTYHFLIATPIHEDKVSIAAKTLSGFGYKGHVFWDTELFIVPPLTLSNPELAQRLLMYRYHNLKGARNKAKKNGYQGAMFPWESTDTGEETTPSWTHPHPITGERVRIWTGDNEQHISSDIAYAILQYWRWRGDDKWFAKYGAEIVLDTARFWKVAWNITLSKTVMNYGCKLVLMNIMRTLITVCSPIAWWSGISKRHNQSGIG